jgi:hypothetical protein
MPCGDESKDFAPNPVQKIRGSSEPAPKSAIEKRSPDRDRIQAGNAVHIGSLVWRCGEPAVNDSDGSAGVDWIGGFRIGNAF